MKRRKIKSKRSGYTHLDNQLIATRIYVTIREGDENPTQLLIGLLHYFLLLLLLSFFFPFRFRLMTWKLIESVVNILLLFFFFLLLECFWFCIRCIVFISMESNSAGRGEGEEGSSFAMFHFFVVFVVFVVVVVLKIVDRTKND